MGCCTLSAREGIGYFGMFAVRPGLQGGGLGSLLLTAAEEVERMLAGLPAREAEVVRLYHLNFLNYRQIGKQLGIPENSGGPILATARQARRKDAEQGR